MSNEKSNPKTLYTLPGRTTDQANNNSNNNTTTNSSTTTASPPTNASTTTAANQYPAAKQPASVANAQCHQQPQLLQQQTAGVDIVAARLQQNPEVIRVGASGTSFYVYVVSIVVDGPATRVKMNEYDHIEALRRRLSRKTGIPVSCQMLLHKNKILRSGTVKDNGLYPGCMITLCLKVEAGLLDNYHSGPTAPLITYGKHQIQMQQQLNHEQNEQSSKAKKKSSGSKRIKEHHDISTSSTPTSRFNSNSFDGADPRMSLSDVDNSLQLEMERNLQHEATRQKMESLKLKMQKRRSQKAVSEA